MNLTRRTFLVALTCGLGARHTQLPAFTAGTGKWLDFGKGAPTLLHGSERIMPLRGQRVITATLKGTFVPDAPPMSRLRESAFESLR